ncbi:MAG: MFS transporter [Legionellaceae bacterium]|nr:MFS transporter [Legionellaceae bacterium]MBP9776197.1 MFS transporter [Legionellaceae bacterium]
MPKRETSLALRNPYLLGSIICTIGALFYCYEFVLRIIPGILQEELRMAFGNLSATAFGQVSALYYYAYSPMQLPVGILMDRFGPRYLLTLACLCCTLGSLLFSFPGLFIAGTGRLLVGFGSSFAFVGVLSAATNWLPLRYFSLVTGLMTTLGMLGLVYGEIQITHLAHILGLKAVLNMSVVVGLILTLFIYAIVRDAPIKRDHHHMPYGEFFKQVWLVLKSKQIWIIAIIGTCLYTSLSVFGELWGKSFLEQAFDLSKIQAAKTISMLFLGWAVGAPLAGYISDQIGNRLMPLTLGAVGSLLFIGLILFDQHLSYVQLNISMFFYGVFSASEIIVFIMAKEYSPTQQLSGTIFAVTNMIVSFGGVVFQPLVGKLLDWSAHSASHHYMHHYSTHNYQIGLSILPLSMLIVVILAFSMKMQAKKN